MRNSWAGHLWKATRCQSDSFARHCQAQPGPQPRSCLRNLIVVMELSMGMCPCALLSFTTTPVACAGGPCLEPCAPLRARSLAARSCPADCLPLTWCQHVGSTPSCVWALLWPPPASRYPSILYFSSVGGSKGSYRSRFWGPCMHTSCLPPSELAYVPPYCLREIQRHILKS